MFFFFFDKYQDDLKKAASSEPIKSIMESDDFYFQKAVDKYEEFKQIAADGEILNALISKAKEMPFSYEKLLAGYPETSLEYQLLKVIGELVSYIDVKAAMKQTLNEYSDKRTMAYTGIRQNDFVVLFLKLKYSEKLADLPDTFRNVLEYIEHPESNISIFSEERKKQIFDVIFEGKDGNLFECMKQIGIQSKNPINDGHVYSFMLHSDAIKRLWSKTTNESFDGIWNDPINISKEQWVEMLQNKSIFLPNDIDIIDKIDSLGGHASCKQLSEKFGGHPTSYISPIVALGKRIKQHTGCIVPQHKKYNDGKEAWWNIPFTGSIKEDNHFDWTIRKELLEAMKNLSDEQIKIINGTKKLTKAKFVYWFEPIISALKQLNGSGTPKQVRELIIVRFRLDENTLANTVGKSKTNEFENDVAWARNYLKDEGYIDGSKNGVWKLTERGWHVQMNDELASRIFFKWVEILKCKREGKPIPEIDITINENISVNDSYTKSDFLSDVFMESESYDTLKALLMRKKNVILQGAPGVGKTFAAKRLAYSVLGEKDDARIMSVQFHQSYSYEDFIMGYRPDGNGFSLKYGVFYKFCKLAENNPDKPYFFIIDEINRGNLSKIFGELLMLIECDKRGEEMTLTYSETPFSVPDNLYIIGMMNTADRSLAIIDYALRRRFCFFELEPAYATVSFQNHLAQNGLPSALSQKIISKIIAVNAEIARDPNLGKGFRIGHSYFCDCKDSNDNWYEDIIRYEIAPLLREYWFDETEKAEECIGGLLR